MLTFKYITCYKQINQRKVTIKIYPIIILTISLMLSIIVVAGVV